MRFQLAAVAALLFAQSAAAEEANRFTPYAAARLTFENGDANQFIFEDGFGGVGALGVHYRDRWRTELSVSYRSSGVKKIPPVEVDGYFRAWAWLLNAYYHPFGVDRAVSPYVGLGGGFNHASVEALATDDAALENPSYAGLGFPKQRYMTKSWQGKLGVAFQVVPDLYFDLAVAYFVSDDRDVTANFPNNATVEAAYRSYSALFGLRAAF